MYTVGTHVGFDAVTNEYMDGADPVLNRFYEADVQFGKFLDWFQNSEFVDNTIIVFTTDHATYADKEYMDAFPKQTREYLSLDEIPFYIYYQDIMPEVISVNGKNSLDLVPTIFDYIDINAPNYFLGTSLFEVGNKTNQFDTTYYCENIYLSSENGKIQAVQNEVIEKVQLYFKANKNNATHIQTKAQSYIKTEVMSETNEINIILENLECDNNAVWLAMWSIKGGQDDIKWYYIEQNEKGRWNYTVDLTAYCSKGEYMIHVYTGEKNPETFIIGTSVVIF